MEIELEKLLIQLSGENYAMGEGEVRALAEVVGAKELEKVEEGLIRIKCPSNRSSIFHNRLGLAHRVMMEMSSEDGESFEHNRTVMDGAIGALSPRVKGKRFAVSTHRLHGGSKDVELQGMRKELGRMLLGGKVDLEDPEVIVEVWAGRGLYMGVRRGTIDRKETEARKVDRRPFFSPISIHPKMARAMINLARLEDGEALYDPFCGTGGILIEAGMMGMKAMGSDVREDMVQGTKENLAHFGLSGEVFVHDVNDTFLDQNMGRDGEMGGGVSGLVTDPPYGRSTRIVGSGASGLIDACFCRAGELLEEGRYMAMVFPDTMEIPAEKGGFVLRERYEEQVHGTLTRVFCVYRKESLG
ncbi:MAG: N-6 DNA methylase [Thermoplasmata archaeon]|nr:N-6 DNA methylase [Thermoplasmata archaeon]